MKVDTYGVEKAHAAGARMTGKVYSGHKLLKELDNVQAVADRFGSAKNCPTKLPSVSHKRSFARYLNSYLATPLCRLSQLIRF